MFICGFISSQLGGTGRDDFLALLELMKNDQVICEQDAPFDPITVTLKEAA
ncbi:segregation and condensation protein A [Lacticaseibacillus rhamnosus MTCC 5462]|nr:segregation and condensation protein A [Lacticaseibacillus rhamnosus MTCC 5462]